MEARHRRVREEDEQGHGDRDRDIQRPRDAALRIAAVLGERRTVLPADEHVQREREAGRQPAQASCQVRPGERHAREMRALVDQHDDADDEHDRHLQEHRDANRSGGDAHAAHSDPDRGAGQHERERLPCGVPRGVVGERQRDHAAGHREHAGERNGVADRDEQRHDDAGLRSERGLDVGDEASRGRLGLRELGDDEGEQDDGDAAGEDRQRRGDARGDRDDSEGEVEVDPGPDVRDRRGGHIGRAQLAGADWMLPARVGPTGVELKAPPERARVPTGYAHRTQARAKLAPRTK